jgi:quercetin dioxygenase-like cupin family protein
MGEGQRHTLGQGAPEVEVLFDGKGRDVAVLAVRIPPGGGMPRHDHGASSVVLVSLSGTIDLSGEGVDEKIELSAGAVGALDVGEAVQLDNRGSVEAKVLVILSPPDFVESIKAWPNAGE